MISMEGHVRQATHQSSPRAWGAWGAWGQEVGSSQNSEDSWISSLFDLFFGLAYTSYILLHSYNFGEHTQTNAIFGHTQSCSKGWHIAFVDILWGQVVDVSDPTSTRLIFPDHSTLQVLLRCGGQPNQSCQIFVHQNPTLKQSAQNDARCWLQEKPVEKSPSPRFFRWICGPQVDKEITEKMMV